MEQIHPDANCQVRNKYLQVSDERNCEHKGERKKMWNLLISHYWPSLVIFLRLYGKQSDVYVENGWFIVFNTTFKNISVILWRSVLSVEETGVPWKNHRPVPSYWRTLSHNVVSSAPRHERCSNSQL